MASALCFAGGFKVAYFVSDEGSEASPTPLVEGSFSHSVHIQRNDSSSFGFINVTLNPVAISGKCGAAIEGTVPPTLPNLQCVL